MNRLTDVGQVCLVSALVLSTLFVQPTAIAQNGRIEVIQISSKGLEKNLLNDSPTRNVTVYLPADYDAVPEKRFPVVYLLHGFLGKNTGWTAELALENVDIANIDRDLKELNIRTITDSLIAEGSVKPMILVAPDCSNAYDGSWYTNSPVIGDWEDFVAKDLICHIDKNYRTIAKRKSRAIAGHSMGGHGAIKLAMKHPEQYCALYAMAPAWIDFARTVEPPFDGSFVDAARTKDTNAFPDLHWRTRATIALAAAIAPNPAMPFNGELPLDAAGNRVDRVWKRWLKHDLTTTMLNKYADNLKQYKAITIDCGTEDNLLPMSKSFSAALKKAGVKHSFKVFKGTHTDCIASQLAKEVLPLFSKTLWHTPMRQGANSLIRDYEEAWNRSDVEQIVSLYAKDATKIGFWGPKLSGLEEIRNSYTGALFSLTGGIRFHLEIKQTSFAGSGAAASSGNWLFKDERGVFLIGGHALFLITQRNMQWRISDVRFALSWNRPKGLTQVLSDTPSRDDLPTPKPTMPNDVVESLRKLWCVHPPKLTADKDFVEYAHLIDAQGHVILGPDHIVREVSNRKGSRSIQLTDVTLRGNIAVVDGTLASTDMGLNGLPRVNFTAIYSQDGDCLRFVSQIECPLPAHLRNPERWAPTIRSFVELDERTKPARGGVVFVGDSDLVQCDLQQWFPELDAINRGFGGSEVEDVVLYMQDVVLKHKPRIVVFSCGGNDIVANKTPGKVHEDFVRFAEKLSAELPACRLLVTAQQTPPKFVDWGDVNENLCTLNTLVKKTADKDDRITFMHETRKVLHDESDGPRSDLFSDDRVHFNNSGYRRWTAVIARYLKEDELSR